MTHVCIYIYIHKCIYTCIHSTYTSIYKCAVVKIAMDLETGLEAGDPSIVLVCIDSTCFNPVTDRCGSGQPGTMATQQEPMKIRDTYVGLFFRATGYTSKIWPNIWLVREFQDPGIPIDMYCSMSISLFMGK